MRASSSFCGLQQMATRPMRVQCKGQGSGISKDPCNAKYRATMAGFASERKRRCQPHIDAGAVRSLEMDRVRFVGHCLSQRKARCASCYGSGECRFCHGTGFELTRIQKTRDVLGWLWFLSWIAITVDCLFLGVSTCWLLFSQGSRTAWTCLAVLGLIVALWATWIYLDSTKWRDAHQRLTSPRWSWVSASILALFTLLGFFFFAYVSPKFP